MAEIIKFKMADIKHKNYLKNPRWRKILKSICKIQNGGGFLLIQLISDDLAAILHFKNLVYVFDTQL